MKTPVAIEVEGLSVTWQRDLVLDVQSVGQAAEWCGSFDILEMGEHFDAYVLTPRSALLPAIPGFPPGRRFTQLPGKWPAPSVHGNIGEAVAALTAVSCLGCTPSGVAHVKAGQGTSKEKTPDLLLRVTPDLQDEISVQWGFSQITFPDWIPCEAKSRKNPSDATGAFREAKKQLQAFWTHLDPAERGFGVACCYVYSPPQSIRVRIFLPPSIIQEALSQFIQEVLQHSGSGNE